MLAFGPLLNAFASWFEDGDPQGATQVRQRLFDFAQSEDLGTLLPSLLFDPDWYASTNSLRMTGDSPALDSLRHYMEVGSSAGHNPTVWFDDTFYRERNPDVRAGIERGRWRCGYHHYLTRGVAEGRSPNREFNELAYLGSNPDVLEAVRSGRVPNGFFHFASRGSDEHRNGSAAPPEPLLALPIAPAYGAVLPSSTFAESLYLSVNQDVRPDGHAMPGMRHWIGSGLAEDLRGVRARISEWVETLYLQANSDISESIRLGHQPTGYHHFLMYGASEGRAWPGEQRAKLERPHLDAALATRSAQMIDGPLISVIVPVYNPPADALRECIASVRAQTYSNWELCLADDGSFEPETVEALVGAGREDERIKVAFLPRNSGISAASNAALRLASGEFVALLDHDDLLAPDALLHVARAFMSGSDVDLVYTDEAKLSEDGEPFGLNPKPGWSPELLLSTMYIGHLTAYRRAVVDQVGGFRSVFDGTQDYDLALRAAEVVRSVVHVPLPLYFWRLSPNSTAGSMDAKPGVLDIQREALEHALVRRGQRGTVTPGHAAGHWNVRLEADDDSPLVSIVIPTAGRSATIGDRTVDLIANCVASLEHHEAYTNIEFVIVHNEDLRPQTLKALARFDRLRLVAYRSDQFNLSEKINLGIREAAGEFVLLLNDDMQCASDGIVQSMLGRMFPGVGLVGARLLYPNGKLQHAGMVWTDAGPTHAMIGEHALTAGPAERLRVMHNCFGVSGACMFLRRAVFLELGGFTPALPTNYNDVDFCLRLRAQGLRIIFDPEVVLYHFESVSKSGTHFWELQRLLLAHPHVEDPYMNPVFCGSSPFFQLRAYGKQQRPEYVAWQLQRIARRRAIKGPPSSIRFSFLLSVYQVKRYQLEELEATICNQTYRNWEWIIVDNGTTSPETLAWFEHARGLDQVMFIRLEQNQGIMGGYGTAFRAATGDYVVPVDADDFLTLDCLEVLAAALEGYGLPDAVYSDEDKASDQGSLHSPFLKPDWDPVLFTNICFVCHICAIKRSTALALKAYTDHAATWCHDWDTFLRLHRAGARIEHVPEILYSWRIHPGSTASIETGTKPATITSQHHVLSRHLQLTQLGNYFELVQNELFPHNGIWRLKPRARAVPPVAIILTGSHDVGRLSAMLLEIARAIRPEDMFLIVDRTDEVGTALERMAPELKARLGLKNVSRLLDDLKLRDALRRCEAKGIEHIALIDAGLARLSRNWLVEGAGMFAIHSDVGAAGGQIVLPDGRVAWRGGFRGFGGMAGSPDYGREAGDSGYHGMSWCQRSCDSVPAVCFFSKADLLAEAAAAMNGGPLSLRELAGHLTVAAWQRNLRIIYTPFVLATLARQVAVDPLLPPDGACPSEAAPNFYHPAFGRKLDSAYALLPASGCEA